MIATSSSSLVLILLLLASVSSAAQIGSYHTSAYIDTTSRAPQLPQLPAKPGRVGPKGSKKRNRRATGPEPVFTPISASQVKAVWGATTILNKGTKPSSKLNTLAGWGQIGAEIIAAGGTVAGAAGGKSDRARCHMIGDALGGKGRKNNLFSCFAYFNNPGMFHFERLLQTEIKSLTGTDQCEMTVTLTFTTKQYPTSVNMNAKCKGRQFFNVDISNTLQPSSVTITHLCNPGANLPLEPGQFRGTSTVAASAAAC